MLHDSQRLGCWIFSAVGPFLDYYCISGNDAKSIQFSDQFMVSCDTDNEGYDGGYLDRDMVFLKKTGVSTEKCVQYQSETKVCPRSAMTSQILKLLNQLAS
ncbi:Cathepsin_B [Hexamita inflata]|uniref:Cathepsin_B n=1 Tax=Hexamita inflata TaxID=28002 RepID=A0ABP1LHJ7_9EUKA